MPPPPHGSVSTSTGLYIQPEPKPLEFNVLAIAAPKLKARETNPPQLRTLQDLFNTFMAGFNSADKIAAGSSKKAAINTGPIGYGNFNNNKYVVWVLQVLTVSQIREGVNFHFWGYKQDEVSEDKGARGDLKEILKKFTDPSKSHTTIAQLLDDASKMNWPHWHD